MSCVDLWTEYYYNLLTRGVLIGWHCAKVQGHAELERYKRVLIGWHCDKVQGHAELEIEKPSGRVKTLPLVKISPNYTYHSNPNSFCANFHLRQSF